jgi:hippurate hydrolase
MTQSALVFLLAAATLSGSELGGLIDPQMPGLVATYQKLHQHPELSYEEERTSAFLAAELRKAGFDVTEHVGRYPDGKPAFGVVALLVNGPGPVLLVRTDMDALPVEEQTGLPYASLAPGKMHACGHDIHMTVMLGTARTLVQLKNRWRGTLMLIGQPAEERIAGARAMLADGLYTRFPKPDFAVALHDDPDTEAGKAGVTPGPVLASSTSVDVTIRGVGGHGAHPDATKDPIVAAAQYILAIQTIVSRQNSPLDPAVVTVGSIHGGSKHNIIPDEVHLQLSIRAYSEEVREKILAALSRTARGIALAAGIPEDRAPIVKVSDTEFTPATYNDPELARRLKGVFAATIGAQNVLDLRPEMASEDFGRFGLDGRQIPTLMFRLGATPAEKLAESRRTGTPVPSLHSSRFAPLPEPTIRTGILCMTAAVLDLLK